MKFVLITYPLIPFSGIFFLLSCKPISVLQPHLHDRLGYNFQNIDMNGKQLKPPLTKADSHQSKVSKMRGISNLRKKKTEIY